MLDHHRSGIARRVERREGDEKAVVAIFPGAALAAALAQADDLRGAGLARHLDILYRQSRAPCGARAVDDLIPCLANQPYLCGDHTEPVQRPAIGLLCQDPHSSIALP